MTKTKKPTKRSSKKGGRPSKFTEDNIGKLVEAFRLDCNIKQATAYVGIHVDTFDKRYHNRDGFSDIIGKKKWENFIEEINRAREFAKMQAKKTLVRSIIKGDVKSAIEFLKRRDDDYRDKVIIEQQNQTNTNPLLERLYTLEQKGKGNTKSSKKKK